MRLSASGVEGSPSAPFWVGLLGCQGCLGLAVFSMSSRSPPCLSPDWPPPPPLGPLPNKDKHCFGPRDLDSWNKLSLATLLDTDVSNPMEYEFNFQLEIRGPCLLAGERELPRPGWGWKEDSRPRRVGERKGREGKLASPDGRQPEAHVPRPRFLLTSMRPKMSLSQGQVSRLSPPSPQWLPQGNVHEDMAVRSPRSSVFFWSHSHKAASCSSPCMAESAGELSKSHHLDPTPELLMTLVWGESWALEHLKVPRRF